MPAVDINRRTTNVLLPAEVSAEVWGATLEESAFMRLARRINMPGSGVDIQTITGEPSADWVDETALKPVATHTFGKKTIRPYKLAVIEPFSNEFRRDKAALYNAYMPYLKHGGIFVPTPKRYFLGDEVFLLLTLPETQDRVPVAGKVVWVTPTGAQGNRTAGVGVQFADGNEGEAAKGRIETLLAGTLNSDKPTHTM